MSPRCKEMFAHFPFSPIHHSFRSTIPSPLLPGPFFHIIVVLVTMPYQSRPSLPARSASLPPLHLEWPQPTVGVQPASVLSTLPEIKDYFSWARLPKALQHEILRNVLTPDQSEDGVMLGREHQAHLRETAIPLFLGLGSWDAYIETASIFYHKVCFTRHANKIAVLKLLSCPDTLRVRSLIHKLEIHIRMPHDLKLFDIGLSDTQSNVPTALHSMRVHGRLREVDFFFHVPEAMDYNDDCITDIDLMGCHLPMARLQIASWDPSSISPGATSPGRSTTVSTAIQPGRVIVAPAILASRAFQSGLLPLLERGVFERSNLTLKLVSAKGDVRDAKIDGHRMFEYWFGATILEVLPNSTAWELAKEKKIDLFPFLPLIEDSSNMLCPQSDEDGDKIMVDVPETQNDDMQSKNGLCIEAAEYRERGDDLLSSPVRYSESSIDSGLFLPSQEASEDLQSMTATTAAEVTDGNEEPRSQGNALPHYKENDLHEGRRLSNCASDISPDQVTTYFDAVEALPHTSNAAETIETDIIADNIYMSTKKDLPGHEASVVAGSLCECITTDEHDSNNPESNGARETSSEEHAMPHEANVLGVKPTASTTGDVDTDTDSDTNSDSDTDSGSQGDTDSSKDTAAEHKSARAELMAASDHASRANGRLLHHESDSDSTDESAREEFPPSRSTAFSKKKTSPHMIPIPNRETDNTSDDSSHSSDDTDMSSDSSSSGVEDNPTSPTIEVPPPPTRCPPVDNSSLVMTGALPSNELSSKSSSDSDSEMSSDSEISSPCDEGRISSETLSQVGKIFGTRAAQRGDSATASKGKVAAPASTRNIPEGSVDLKARSVEASSLSTSDDSDTDCSGSDSDSGSDAWRAKAKPAGIASKPVVDTTPVRSITATARQIQPTQQKKPRGSNNNDNSTPRSANKRKTPPKSTDNTPLSKRQRQKRRRNMAKQKKRKVSAAQQ